MFYFWLAEQLKMPVRVMLQIIDSKEISEWIAYYKAKKIQQEQPNEQKLTEQLKTIPHIIKGIKK